MSAILVPRFTVTLPTDGSTAVSFSDLLSKHRAEHNAQPFPAGASSDLHQLLEARLTGTALSGGSSGSGAAVSAAASGAEAPPKTPRSSKRSTGTGARARRKGSPGDDDDSDDPDTAAMDAEGREKVRGSNAEEEDDDDGDDDDDENDDDDDEGDEDDDDDEDDNDNDNDDEDEEAEQGGSDSRGKKSKRAKPGDAAEEGEGGDNDDDDDEDNDDDDEEEEDDGDENGSVGCEEEEEEAEAEEAEEDDTAAAKVVRPSGSGGGMDTSEDAPAKTTPAASKPKKRAVLLGVPEPLGAGVGAGTGAGSAPAAGASEPAGGGRELFGRVIAKYELLSQGVMTDPDLYDQLLGTDWSGRNAHKKKKKKKGASKSDMHYDLDDDFIDDSDLYAQHRELEHLQSRTQHSGFYAHRGDGNLEIISDSDDDNGKGTLSSRHKRGGSSHGSKSKAKKNTTATAKSKSKSKSKSTSNPSKKVPDMVPSTSAASAVTSGHTGAFLKPLGILLRTARVSSVTNSSLIPTLLRLNYLALLENALRNVSDISETLMVRIFRHIATRVPVGTLAGFARAKFVSSSKSAPEDDMQAASIAVQHFTCLLVSCHRNDLFLEHSLRRLSTAEVKILLSILLQLLRVHTKHPLPPDAPSKTRAAPTPQTPMPRYSHVLDWTRMVVDAHFTQLVLASSVDKRINDLLSSFREISAQQIELCESIDTLHGHVAFIAQKRPLPVSPIPDYSVEFVSL